MTHVNSDIKTIIEAINKAAEVITSTMGGLGKNVILADDKEFIFTKDGVSVAKKINFPDSTENLGARLLINAADQTVKECGDGTTLTSLFVKEFLKLYQDSIHQFETASSFSEYIKEEIEKVKQYLNNNKEVIENNMDIYKVAYTSSKSSRIASFIADIYKATGLKANISLEYSRTSNNTYFDVVDGLEFPTGMIHNGFGNQENGTCIFDNPYLFISKDPIVVPDDYEQLISDCFENGDPIVFIAPMFSEAFIRFALLNKKSKGLQICLVKLPGYGEAILENIKDMKAFMAEDAPVVNKIKITGYDFTLYNTTSKKKIEKRVKELTGLAQAAVEDYFEQDYLNRISRLTQSSAVIYVGGITEKNAKEEYDRIEDALGAVKVAIKNGFVKGAGVTLYHYAKQTNTLLSSVLKAPYVTILSNANKFNIIKEESEIPYNVKTGQYDINISDPVNVIQSALDNSFALVHLLINTKFIVYENN